MNRSPSAPPPAWAKQRIGYQIFVDSFAAGKPIEEKAELYAASVYDKDPTLLNWQDSFEKYNYGYSFFGGDLPGVRQSVQTYLADLGINLLYLTPIFLAESNHKYDTLDYRRIDPQFGSFEDFQNLLSDCHQHDIKVILDGVFNHTSYHHEWYKKARQGIPPFVDYYQKNEDGYFLNWAGVETLPLLNHNHPDVRACFYGDENSIVPYWLQQGADGWRLDVAEGLGVEVIQKIKTAMLKYSSNTALYGEVMESYGKPWLGDDRLDGVMNYVFLGTTVNFLRGDIDGEEYLHELNKMFDEYPTEQLKCSWNIISTHDTNRMITEVEGDENRFKMAVTLQFTYPGIPMIYYGDELGVAPGEKDVSNRRGMKWERVDILHRKGTEPRRPVQPMDWQRVNEYGSFHFFYKHLIWLRNTQPVLTDGDFLPAFASRDAIGFFRVDEKNAALVMINRGPRQQLEMPVPADLKRRELQLRGLHGPIRRLDLRGDSVSLDLEANNSFIFVE